MGTLFVVATPIGNLNDISSRALQTLREVDLIACEDTRHTIKLLNHFGIQKPMTSYHDFNEQQKAEELANKLAGAATIALVSDAGTPAIADPGYRIVRLCRERGLPVVVIPGPNAATAALAASGLASDEFMFLGFLPSKKNARREKLTVLANLTCTLVFYEAPHRIETVLEDMQDVLGDREVCVARELTKIHEEFLFGSVSEVRPRVKPIGEFVVVVSGATQAREAAPSTREEVLKRLGMTRNQLYELFFKKGTAL
ncbi:MAG: 16S rRNA (cytidine(1402)-2'-O)-methyltransferase [Acidobacteria bacterium]|nr:MAG: 16S rRNA (cytidine(1402)-2'-O)-methyltransferase [Acidobacteriota bacterium]